MANDVSDANEGGPRKKSLLFNIYSQRSIAPSQKTSLRMFSASVIPGIACLNFKDINAVIDWLFS